MTATTIKPKNEKNPYTATSEGLFLNGKPAKLEFGDTDQIEAIRKYEKRIAEFKGPGLYVDPEIEATLRFNCLCGYPLTYTADITVKGLYEFNYDECTCRNCNQPFYFEVNEADEITAHYREKPPADK